MNSHEPFAARFDSIEIDPARAPSPAAIDHALALAAPTAAVPEIETPGFYLLNDAGGRFEVDRDFGMVSLRDASLVEHEFGAVHPVRLRVVETSGSSYELDMQLRITGRVPQMVGADEFAFLANLTTDRPVPEATPRAPAAKQCATIAWSTFAAAANPGAAQPIGHETAKFGALLTAPLPHVSVTHATITFGEHVPAPASAQADWSI